MATLPQNSTADMWEALNWSRGQIAKKPKNKNQPLVVKEAPTKPGLYRMKWIGEESWKAVQKSMTVKSTLKCADRIFEYQELAPPILLTIGKTTDLNERICQHFGTNPNNNRVISRLGHLILPKPVYEELIELVVQNIQIEWVKVDSWVDRCLLEKYGCAVERPILDLEAEH